MILFVNILLIGPLRELGSRGCHFFLGGEGVTFLRITHWLDTHCGKLSYELGSDAQNVSGSHY